MGNAVCTSPEPISLDDILRSQYADLKRRVLTDCELLPNHIFERFLRYQHNIKAFVFRRSALSIPPSRGERHRGMVLTDQVTVEAVDLSQPSLCLDDTAVYMLLHIQRLPSAATEREEPNPVFPVHERGQREWDAERYGSDQPPPWVSLMGGVFTPRGLATPFATSIGKPVLAPPPSVTSTRGADGGEFRYSLHMLTGNRANPLVAAVSVLHAMRLERSLMESVELVRRMFFNYSPSCPTRVREPVALGEFTSRRPSRREPHQSHRRQPFSLQHSPLHPSRGQRLTEEYVNNALLRVLHRVRSRPALPPVTATLASARGTLSRCSTPRGATPRGKMGTPTAASCGPYAMHASPGGGMSGGGGMGPAQGPPVLEIPRLRFAPDAPRSAHVEPPLNAPRRSNTQTPQATQREGNSSASNLTSSRTPQASVASPRFPIIANLRLSEALRGLGEGTGETDEIRMTEERMQKLKAASPQATEVLPWLFVGGEEAARDRAQLLEKGITAVVNTVAFAMGNLHDDVFRYLALYVSDSPDEPIFPLFPVVIRFIEEVRMSGGKIFVHCHQGVSRSCSFIISYVMWHQGMCYDRAYEFVRARRTVCSPNAGFYVNLLLWENQLSTPVLNKAYAFVPYTDYLFPFSFRLALAFRFHQKSHDDDDAHIINPFVRTIYDKSESYAVDPRLSYGILLGERSLRSGDRTSTISSYFFAGMECDTVVQQQAKEDWDAFIKYNFYHGTPKSSKNNKGEFVTFTPLGSLRGPTETLRTIRDLGGTIEEAVFNRQRLGSEIMYVPKPKLTHDHCWDNLLARHDMVFSFANHLAEQQRVSLATLNRKRAREEERRRLARLTPTTPRLSPHTGNGNGSGRCSLGLQPIPIHTPSMTSTFAATSGTSPHVSTAINASSAAIAAASPASSRVGAVPRRPSPLSSPIDTSAGAVEVEVYAYPFDAPPQTDIIDVTDLDSTGCYAVVVPSSLGAGGPPRVFLWLGAHCRIREAEGWQAYQHKLRGVKGVRLWSGVVLKTPIEEVVYEGEEPDDFLLALD